MKDYLLVDFDGNITKIEHDLENNKIFISSEYFNNNRYEITHIDIHEDKFHNSLLILTPEGKNLWDECVKEKNINSLIIRLYFTLKSFDKKII